MFGQVFVYFITVLIINNANIASGSKDGLSVLSNVLLGKHSRSPIIVILDSSSEQNDALRSNDHHVGNKELKSLGDDNMNHQKASYWMTEILRSTGDKNDPLVQSINENFKSALRSRCSKYYECNIKCTLKRQKKPCEKSCKDVFDHLTMCDPPGGKKETCSCEDSEDACEKENPCGKTGKTMPPAWRL